MKKVRLKVNLDVVWPNGKVFSVGESQTVDLNSKELERRVLGVDNWINYVVTHALESVLMTEAKQYEYQQDHQ